MSEIIRVMMLPLFAWLSIVVSLSVSLAITLAPTNVFAATTIAATTKNKVKPTTSGQEVARVLSSYRTAAAVKAKVKKTIIQEAQGTESKSEGDFYISKGKIRMEIREPERSLLVFDGKTVWFETPIDEDQVHVTKMRIGDLKRADSLLTALFDPKDPLLKTFSLVKTEAKDGRKIYRFEPKDKKKSEVKMFEIALKNKEIQRITYLDKLENRVSLEFSEVSKGAVSSSKFIYHVPKNAELVEM